MRKLTDRQVITGLFFAILLSSIAATKAIAENLLPPQKVIQSVSAQLQKKMQDKSFTRDFPQVTRFVNDVIYPHIDFNQVARLVLGKHWSTATAQERERFQREFQTLLVRTYSRAFVEYTDWSMRFQPIQMNSDAVKIMVRTDVLQPGLQPVNVNYRMFLSQGKWKVYDIMIEGVSLVTNYRTTFNDEIQRKGSLSIVIDELAKRNTEALSGQRS